MSILLLLFLSACGTKNPSELYTLTDLNVESVKGRNSDVIFTKEGVSEKYYIYHDNHYKFLADIYSIRKHTDYDGKVDIIVDRFGNVVFVTLSEHRK